MILNPEEDRMKEREKPRHTDHSKKIVVKVNKAFRFSIPEEASVRIEYTSHFFEENGLFDWIDEFKLGTAGYRDTLNMNDFFATDAPFNAHTVLIFAEAMARIYDRRGCLTLHVGGEVRRYTRDIIGLIARVFARHGVSVHLHGDKETTPIWASSFGVFFNELDGGANITASHSQSYKQGIKPMDERGMQLLDMADEIQTEVKKIGKEAFEDGFSLSLSPLSSSLIQRDFHYLAPYSEYLKGIVPKEAFRFMRQAQDQGMKVGASTVGGSMHENSLPIFQHFGINPAPEGMIQYFQWEKRDDFHRVGEIDGEDYGCDPTKPVIYRNIGLKEKLLNGEIHFGFIWDPDGDRYNIVTIADASLSRRAVEMGLEVEEIEQNDHCVVYFKPNQIYFLNAALRLEMMVESGELFEYDFVIGTTYPTSRSIGELAEVFNRKYAEEFAGKGHRIRVFNTPVGFKYFGQMVGDIEAQVERGGEVFLEYVTGDRISVGQRPRILIMAEESGGAAMGSLSWATSKNGKRRSLALKEKDGMQLSLMNLGIMAKLFLEGKSYAALYIETVEKYGIRYKYYDRIDKKLFDEGLTGEARERARSIGNKAKEYMVETFRELTRGPSAAAAGESLQELVGERVTIPEIRRVFWAGDGTYIDFGTFWFELRASGTDAVLRFYIEGQEKGLLESVNQAFVGMADKKIRELSPAGDL